MLHSRTILIGLLLILVVALIYTNCNDKPKKENYADVFYNKELDSSMVSRPTFNSNLDPNNMNLRSDPNVYAGFLSGDSPDIGNLASYNRIASHSLGGRDSRNEYFKLKDGKEGFDSGDMEDMKLQAVVQPAGLDDSPSSEGFNFMNRRPPTENTRGRRVDSKMRVLNGLPSGGKTVGTSDAANYVRYADKDYGPLVAYDKKKKVGAMKNTSGYKKIPSDLASLGSDGTFQSRKVNSDAMVYKQSLNNNYNPNTLKYTVPKDLLPAPDMRQPLARDPSDPSNFMYDRTIFAPLKKRNHNEADRIRGDLDIEPVKTGWFDIATVPTVDLVKGYFGYYNDIQEYQDLQDIAYTRARNQATGQSTSKSTTALSELTTMMNKDMLKPRLAYGTQPNLEGPVNPWGQKRAFAL
jgi:hypothetical protein